MHEAIERWDIFELTLNGPAAGNPFVDVSLSANFRHEHRTINANGFYNGNGVYRVRFMPDVLGEWTYETVSNREELGGVTGGFACVAPAVPNHAVQNHGPVGVHGQHHFSYADGTPYIAVGTTCYAWAHQGDALEEQTLETLKSAPFNKLRMCVFPKDYTYSRNEPAYYPFERDAGGAWDFSRFHPAFFQHFEERVGQLRELGIEADVILFHPYDRWGFADMGAENDERYLRYLVARLSAYRNVWWSMANEYDLVPGKHEADWDRIFRIVQESDPHQHLRSIHNCREFYDHAKPWVTHQSIQHNDVSRTAEWRARCKKPVVIDECKYEGNVEQRWGNISARELVHRFWLVTVSGGYAGHGETYLHPEDILWWSKGGVLHGESPARIAFLRRLLEESGCRGLDPVHPWGAGVEGEYYLFYCGVAQPGAWTLTLPEGIEYGVDLIDTWAMTASPFEKTYTGKFTLPMPTKSHMALQVRALNKADQAEMDQIRIGVIGLGFGKHHVRTLANMAEAKLVAVADRRFDAPGGLTDFAARYSANAYRDGREMMERERLDAISLCVAPRGREPLLRYAAENGIPVLVEKPWAANLEHAQRLAALCREHNAAVMPAFSFRFHPALAKLRALMDGELGEGLLLNGEYLFNWQGPAESWLWDADNGGGFFNENSCHLFDAVCHLLGDPISVVAETSNPLDAPGDNAAAVTLRFASGAVAALTLGGLGTNAFRNFPRLDIVTRNGQAHLAGQAHVWQSLEWATRDSEAVQQFVQPPEGLGRTRYTDAFEHFFECIRTGQPPSVTVADGVRSVAIAQALYESARTGEQVML